MNAIYSISCHIFLQVSLYTIKRSTKEVQPLYTSMDEVYIKTKIHMLMKSNTYKYYLWRLH